jgi:hypothetical protein
MLKNSGKRAKGIYVIPNFQNPTGGNPFTKSTRAPHRPGGNL